MSRGSTPRLAGVAVLLAAAAGCSDGPKTKPVFPVRGRLTYDGTPMARALIAFYPVDPNDRATPSHGTADEDGRYVMHTYREGDGVPAGDYVVTVFWPGPRPRAADKAAGLAAPGSPEAEDATPDRLRGAYAQAGKTKLRATVRGQDNEIDFPFPTP